jgi:hypothetical protein
MARRAAGRTGSLPIERALVRAGAAAALTAVDGVATLRLAQGAHTIHGGVRANI